MRSPTTAKLWIAPMIAGLLAAAPTAPAFAEDIEQRCLYYAGRGKYDESKTPGCDCLKRRLKRHHEEALALSKIGDPEKRYAAATVRARIAMDICTRQSNRD